MFPCTTNRYVSPIPVRPFSGFDIYLCSLVPTTHTWHLLPLNCCCLPLLPLTVSLLLPCVCLCVVVSAQAVERALSRVAQVCIRPFTHFHRQHARPCFPPNVSILHACRGLAHACVSTAMTFMPTTMHPNDLGLWLLYFRTRVSIVLFSPCCPCGAYPGWSTPGTALPASVLCRVCLASCTACFQHRMLAPRPPVPEVLS